MTIWDDAKTTLSGSHRYGDGLSWQITTQGIALGDTPPDPARTETVAEVFGWIGEWIRTAATATNVPVELLAATICTETVGSLGVGDAALDFRVELPNFESDNTTPRLVRAGCCGIFLSIARSTLGNAPITSANLFDPTTALTAAATHIANDFNVTRLQPPMVAAAYNTFAAGALLDNDSPWRMASFDGDHNRITRFVEWFNAAILACNSDSSFYGEAPSFSLAMARMAPPPDPSSPASSSRFQKPESQDAIDAGVMVLSESHPSIAGIWALDDLTLTQIKGVANDYGSGAGLPLGYPVFAYPDKSSTNHMMDGPAVQALYRAMRDYVAQISMYDVGRSPGLPGQPVNAG